MSRSHADIRDLGRGRKRAPALWRAPLAMGLLSMVGLLAGLVWDGWGDWLSWIALAVPVAVMLWYGWIRRG